jgi:hypothetical protein
MCTKHAIFAVLQSIREEAFTGIITEETKRTLISVFAELTLIAELAFFDLIAIDAIFTAYNPLGITYILRISCVDAEIRILDMVSMISKFGILTIFCK